MRRKRHAIAFWSCFTLCVIIAIVWLASALVYAECDNMTRHVDANGYQFVDNGFVICLQPGELSIEGAGSVANWASADRRWIFAWRDHSNWTFGLWPQARGPGFACESGFGWHVTVPFWIMLTIGGIPTAWLWRRRRRRFSPTRCPECGYNLTGNTSGRCPECGTPIEAATAESR
jgi:hypothetical protein